MLMSMLLLRLPVAVVLFIHASEVCSVISTPVRLPSYPLAVRSPYLSTWIQGDHQGIRDKAVEFWNGQALGWTSLVRINGTVYSLFGAAPKEVQTRAATQLRQTFTASTTTFQFEVSGVVIEMTFENPVTPYDYKRQCLPLSYVEVTLSAFEHHQEVDLYFDINGAWVSSDTSSEITWAVESQNLPHTGNAVVSQRIQRSNQLLFSETDDMADWGSLYWSCDSSKQMTYSAGYSAHSARKHFLTVGNLTNKLDATHRPINQQEPVFAFSKTFLPSSTPQSSLYTIGLIQVQALQATLTAKGAEVVLPLFRRFFKNSLDMVMWHFMDYKHKTHKAFAERTYSESSQISLDYATIVASSAIQAMGGTQFVINPEDPIGEPHLWMKEISSDGNMQTSDVLYPALPFFLYSNPKLAIALLEPVLLHQEAGLYPHKYAMHDLGSSYPNGTGHQDGKDEYMPVEECGNNLIMLLATHDAMVATSSVDETLVARNWLSKHYKIALQWSQYLIDYGLVTELQLSTDDFAGRLANQTNLAVKAIVGIKCMSVIASLTRHYEDAEDFDRVSKDYVRRWLLLAYDEGVPFAKLAYQWKGSWGTLYNLYCDVLLDLQIFPDLVYEQQDSWYAKVLAPYGLPLDSRHLYTKSDWEMFTASFSSPQLYRSLYGRVADWINSTETRKPLIDLYDTVHGANAVNMFTNRPVVGGHFAHLALEKMRSARSKIKGTRVNRDLGPLHRGISQEIFEI